MDPTSNCTLSTQIGCEGLHTCAGWARYLIIMGKYDWQIPTPGSHVGDPLERKEASANRLHRASGLQPEAGPLVIGALSFKGREGLRKKGLLEKGYLYEWFDGGIEVAMN